jgi:uncharacterized OB-fold protein
MCSTPTVPEGTESTFNLEFPYRRSAGPIVGAFLTGLKERRIVGVRSPTGGVICPPLEYDPQTAAELTEVVDLPDTGTVQEFAWVSEPLRKHPLDRPFAWALIQIDGADTRLLHAVDTGSRAAMNRGLRVKARWSDEPQGHISDIACFVPENADD